MNRLPLQPDDKIRVGAEETCAGSFSSGSLRKSSVCSSAPSGKNPGRKWPPLEITSLPKSARSPRLVEEGELGVGGDVLRYCVLRAHVVQGFAHDLVIALHNKLSEGFRRN